MTPGVRSAVLFVVVSLVALLVYEDFQAFLAMQRMDHHTFQVAADSLRQASMNLGAMSTRLDHAESRINSVEAYAYAQLELAEIRHKEEVSNLKKRLARKARPLPPSPPKESE